MQRSCSRLIRQLIQADSTLFTSFRAISSCPNYFTLLDMPQDFSLDTNKLTQHFRTKQMLYHPDRHAGQSRVEQSQSEDMSARLNVAYETLRDPLRRARHLLQLNGLPLNEDGDQIPDEFLEELLQLNQRVHLAEQPEQITALVGELTWHQDQLLAQLQQSFRQKDFQTACTLFQRLMFYASALKRAEEKNL